MTEQTRKELERAKDRLRTNISAQLRDRMKLMRMDVKDLKEASGVSDDTIYKIRAGDRGVNMDNVALLANALCVPAAVLLMPLPVDNGADE